MIAIAIVFTASALGYTPEWGSLIEAAIRSGQSTAIFPALGPAFYGVAGLVAFLVLLALLRSFAMLLGRMRKPSPLQKRPFKTPATPEVSSATDIGVRAETGASPRAERPAGVRDRATDTPTLPPVQESRNPTSAQRKAIHASALQAIESRTLRVAQTSEPRRRSSDYEGPRRRATDNPSKSALYHGPHRRSTDHLAAIPGLSAERKGVIRLVDIDGPCPLGVSPRNEPIPEPGSRN